MKTKVNQAFSDALHNSGRRRVLKSAAAAPVALLAATTAQASHDGSSSRGAIVSPPTTPFLEALPIMPVLPQRLLTDPAFAIPPTTLPNRAINPATGIPFEGRGDAHQLRALNEPQFFFAQRFGAVPAVSIHPNLAPQVNFWGANLGGANFNQPSSPGYDPPMTPLPTLVSRYGDGVNTAMLVRRFNNIPTGAPSGGFGKNQITLHLHNFHTAPDSDGGPCDPRLGALSEAPLTQGRFFFPGQYYDYYYNMKRAGFTPAGGFAPDGDVRESLGTLWYHDHREAHTAENVYKGLAGFHLVFNAHDTGDENTGFRLPSFPQFDIPLIFTDLLIDPATGQAAFDLFDTIGHLGDKYLVNGKIQPFFNVSKRRYRLRLLDKGPSRYYQLFLTNPDNLAQSIPYWHIMNDGNLLPKPLLVTSIKLGVAERGDMIVDFNKLTAAGGAAQGATRLWLENRLIQTKGDGPSIDRDGRTELHAPGNRANVLLEFRIGAVAADASRDPATITSFAPITLPPIETPVLTRTFEFDDSRDGWVINGKLISCDEVRFTMKRGTTERWIYKNGRDWSHPIHHHFVEGRITKRNGVATAANSPENSRKDVVNLGPDDEIEFLLKVTDYLGVYAMHCHNVVHEDHAMMLLFAVADVGDTNQNP